VFSVREYLLLLQPAVLLPAVRFLLFSVLPVLQRVPVLSGLIQQLYPDVHKADGWVKIGLHVWVSASRALHGIIPHRVERFVTQRPGETEIYDHSH
jgi:hypothetical protein